jgi:hypothetical protein
MRPISAYAKKKGRPNPADSAKQHPADNALGSRVYRLGWWPVLIASGTGFSVIAAKVYHMLARRLDHFGPIVSLQESIHDIVSRRVQGKALRLICKAVAG